MCLFNYVLSSFPQADVVLVMTCSIREGAEQKIWRRLHTFKSMKKKRSRLLPPLQIGILGLYFVLVKNKLLSNICGQDLMIFSDSM